MVESTGYNHVVLVYSVSERNNSRWNTFISAPENLSLIEDNSKIGLFWETKHNPQIFRPVHKISEKTMSINLHNSVVIYQ